MEKKILTTHNIASLCHVDMKTVINWTKDGSLKAYKTKGGHRRIKKDDLIEFLNKHDMPISLKKSILIVDDDDSIRSALTEFFESKGYIVDEADDGFNAGIIFEAKRPDVVILDLVMPGIDGMKTCEKIREIEGAKRTKIILLTGYATKENFKKAEESGADKCIAKPVDSDVLFEEVGKLMGYPENRRLNGK